MVGETAEKAAFFIGHHGQLYFCRRRAYKRSDASVSCCALNICCSQVNSGAADKNADGDDWTAVTIDDTPKTPIRHFQLEGLKPNKRYKLKVRAENDLDWSDYSNEFIFRTAPGNYTHIIPVHYTCILYSRMIQNNGLHFALFGHVKELLCTACLLLIYTAMLDLLAAEILFAVSDGFSLMNTILCFSRVFVAQHAQNIRLATDTLICVTYDCISAFVRVHKC